MRSKSIQRAAERSVSARKTSANEGKVVQILYFSFLNVVVGALFGGLVILMVYKVSGYKWFFSTMLAQNVTTIVKSADLSAIEKKRGKLLMPFHYLNFVNEKTPEDAVVLFPFDESHYKDGKFKIENFKHPKRTVMNKSFVSSLIYPRRAVFLKDKDSDPYFPHYTHVALLGGFGYDHLTYQVRNHPSLSILPRHHKKSQ